MLWPLEQCSSLKPVDNGLEKITVRDLKGQKRPCPEIHKLCFSSLSDVLSWACFLRQCGVIRWSLPYERRRRMKIYVAAAAALPSASSRKPQTHEEKKRRWRCSWFELLARGAALSARSNKPAPHTLGHLLPGGGPCALHLVSYSPPIAIYCCSAHLPAGWRQQIAGGTKVSPLLGGNGTRNRVRQNVE